MRKNWLAVLSVPFILLLVAGAVWSATNSGADSFKTYVDTKTTTLGGDSVNVAINVLNTGGAVNTTSNGLSGDVLFEVTSQLGVTSWQDTNADGYIDTTNDAAANQPDAWFTADVDQYILPVNGRIFGSIAYAGVSGQDTVVINMYESQVAGGGAAPNQVVPGTLLQTYSFNVTVGQGAAEVNRLAVVCGAVGQNLGPDANQAAGNDNLTNDLNLFGVGTFTTLYGETLYDEAAADGTADVTVSNAGVDFGLHVRATNGANAVDQSITGAKVKVYFVRAATMANTLAVGSTDTTPSTKAKIYNTDNPDGIEELEVTLTDGVWDGIVQLRDAGWWLPVVYQDHENGAKAINVQRASADAANNIVLHRVAPKNTCTGLTLAAGTTAVQDDPADNTAVDDAIQRGFAVSLTDEYGNACPAPQALTVSFAASPDGTIQNLAIAAGNSSGRTGSGANSVDLPDAIGNWSVTASIAALGLTSNTVSVKVVDAALTNDAAGARWIDDDGLLDAARAYTAGQDINIWLEQNFVTNNGLVGATAYLGSYTNTIQKTEQGIYGVDQDGDGSTTSYVTSFAATSSGNNASFWYGIQGDPVAPIYFQNGVANGFVGGGAALVGTQDIDIAPAASSTVAYLDYSGTEQTTYDLLSGDLFVLWGQRFQLADMYGNGVAPAANLNFLSGLASADSNSFTLPGGGLDLDNWAPGNAPGAAAATNNVGLNMGLNRGADTEWVTVDFGDAVADDSDTLNATLSSTAASTYAFSLLNIGNPFTQIKLSSNSGVTSTIEMPQNGVIPVLVETLDANNNRLPSDTATDLLIKISNTNLNVFNDSAAQAALTTGSTLGTAGIGGRAILRVMAGAATGTTTIDVQTTDGTITSNTLTIDVKAQAPDQPIQGDEIVAGSGTTDPADVTVTEDDTVDLFVFTDIDGFTPTACWVTLNLEGTNFYWVYDEANSAWVRFNFVSEGHADYVDGLPTLADAVTNYPFTATGADQQVGNDLPMTGLSGLVFNITFWYFDADGALQSFDYKVTVS